jgi:hypothetical protein
LETAVPIVSSEQSGVVFSVNPSGCAAEGSPGIQVVGANLNGTSNSTAPFSIIVP